MDHGQLVTGNWTKNPNDDREEYQKKNIHKPSDHQISFSHFHDENSNCVRPNMQNKQKFNRDKWFNMARKIKKWFSKKSRIKKYYTNSVKWTQEEKKLSWTNNHVCADSAWVGTTTKTTKFHFDFLAHFSFLSLTLSLSSKKVFHFTRYQMWYSHFTCEISFGLPPFFSMAKSEYWQFDKSMGCLLRIAQTWPFTIMSE